MQGEILQESNPKNIKLNDDLSSDELCNMALDNLLNLTGLDNVKKEVMKLAHYLKYLKKVEGKITLDKLNLHMVFKGNPGTGKTTVARIMANILYYLGYLSSDKIIEVTPSDFIAGYVGQTAIKTRKLLNKFRGGLIFIDEAYSFINGSDESSCSFAGEAITEIIKEMESKETIFIFAGYGDEMEEFINLNPGIRSRVGYYISFDDYTEEELYNIFLSKLSNTGFSIYDDASCEIKKIIGIKMREKNFGNGRMIDNLYNKLLLEHAMINSDEVSDEKLLTISKEAALNIECKNMKGVCSE